MGMATLARVTSEPIERAASKPFCVATRCADVDDFIAKFHASCDETSMFVASRDTRAIGHTSPFIVLLADKTPVMRGTCTVLESWIDENNPFGRPGIRISLDQLTDSSRPIFDRLLAARGGVTPLIKTPAKPHRAGTMIGFPVLRVPGLEAGPQPVQDPPTERMSMPPAAVIELGLTRPLPPLPPSPVAIKVESSNSVKRTKGIRIATPCTSVDKFIEAFHSCCEPSSFFIATRSTRPIGLESAFSIDLADGRPMLRGYCTVLEAWKTGANRFKKPGVLIGLKQLTADSRQLFDRLLAAGKPAADVNEAKPAVVVDRQTRPMVALSKERFAVPVIKPVAKPLSPPARIAVATPAVPVPVAAPASSVDSDWSSPVETEAPALPEPPSPRAETEDAVTVSEITSADPVAPLERALDAAPMIPKIPVEREIPVELDVEPPAPVLVAPVFEAAPELPVPVAIEAPVEVPVAAPVIVAKSRRLAFALTFVVGIALGAVAGFTARPALVPTTTTTTVVTAPAPIAMTPTAAPVATPPPAPPQPAVAPPAAAAETPAEVPVAHDVRPAPVHAVHAPAVAPAVKRQPVKRFVRPAKRVPACTALDCL